MQIILDKITPPAQKPGIARARLLSTLHSSLNNCTSTIINGRAGTGKTLLAADFAARCGRRVAWYKVDASDGDIKIFFKYLIESVRSKRPGFGDGALVSLIETATLDDTPMLAEAFVYELLEQAGEPLLIVVDDLHLIYDAEWVVPFFRRLLPLLPADAHMLIMGRSLPPAPLWRMRSKQMLCVIEEQTLYFTQREAAKLFESYGLSRAQSDISWRQTHGRASALDEKARALREAREEIVSEQVFTVKRSPAPKRRVRRVNGYVI